MEATTRENIKVSICPDATTAANAAGRLINNLLAKLFNIPVLFLTSGGSALRLLSYINDQLISGNATLGVVDERCCFDPAVNNFAQFAQTDFFQRVTMAGATSISTVPRENEMLAGLALRFDLGLKTWRRAHPQGKVMATLGIGETGGIGGIMPFAEDTAGFNRLFEDINHWAVGYDASGKTPHPLRVTVTFPFLRQIDWGIAYVCGQAKRDSLSRVLADTGDLARTPARIFWQMKQVFLFTDLSLG